MLEAGELNLTSNIQTALSELSQSLSATLSLRATIDEAISTDMDIPRIIDTLTEQIDSVLDTHQESIPSPPVREVLKSIEALLPDIKIIKSIYSNAAEAPREWLEVCGRVINSIQTIKETVGKVLPKVLDQSLNEVMVGYLHTIEHLLVQFKMGVSTIAFGLQLKGFDSMTFIMPIKDFIFITYPFVYNLQEATTGLLLEKKVV